MLLMQVSFVTHKPMAQHDGARVAKVTIETVLKGSATLASKEATEVFTGDACYCVNAPFNVGEKYLIFAYNTDNTLSSLGGCSTQAYSPKSEERVRALLQNDED